MGTVVDEQRGAKRLTRWVRMAVLRSLGRSDYKRWGDPGNLEAWWETRTQKLAAMVPTNARVIEFGAGKRALERYLAPTCSYVASDLVERGPDTFVCDLNRRPLPDLHSLHANVAVFAGVLEYVRDVPAVVAWLSDHVRYCVASYAVARPHSESDQGQMQRGRPVRAGDRVSNPTELREARLEAVEVLAAR